MRCSRTRSSRKSDRGEGKSALYCEVSLIIRLTISIKCIGRAAPYEKANFLFLRFRWFHQLTDRVKGDAKLRIVFIFQLALPPNQHLVQRNGFA